MLLCNGEPVNLKSVSGSGGFAARKIKEMRKELKFPLRFMLPDDHKAAVMNYDRKNESRQLSYETSQGVAVRLSHNYRTKEGSLQKWIYYENTVQQEKKTKYFPRNYMLKYHMIFTEQDVELLFYLIYISGHCEPLIGLTEQNKLKKRTYMILNDPTAGAIKAGNMRRAETKVSSMLYDPDILGEKELRILAKSYYIQDVDNIDELDVLRDRIFKIVLKGSDKDSVEKFLEKANMGNLTKIQAMITEAIDKRVIHIKDQPSGRKAWIFLDVEGKDGALIYETLPQERPKKALTDLLMSNSSVVETIEKQLAVSAEASKDKDE